MIIFLEIIFELSLKSLFELINRIFNDCRKEYISTLTWNEGGLMLLGRKIRINKFRI